MRNYMYNDYTILFKQDFSQYYAQLKSWHAFWCWLIKKTSLEWMDSSYDLKEKEIVGR